MTTDILFPGGWAEIDVDDYIAQHGLFFNQVDLKVIPYYILLDKIRLGGMLLALLENDPLWDHSHHRQRLNEATQKEMRRQLTLLVAEYTRRVAARLMMIDSQPKFFLGAYMSIKKEPPAQVIGMKTVEIGATIAR